MAPRILLALVLLVVAAAGCSQTASAPEDPTMAALHELRSGRFDDAILLASEAIKAQPNNAEAYLYRGRAYQARNAMGDPQRAIADFTESIRLAPEASDAYYSRGRVYHSLGQTDLAESDEAKARSLDKLAQQVHQKQPELVPQPGMSKPKETSSERSAPKTASQLLAESDDSGFGELGTVAPAAPSLTTTPADVAPRSPMAEFNSRQAAETTDPATTTSTVQTDVFGRPIVPLPQQATAPAENATAADPMATPGTPANPTSPIAPGLGRPLPTPQAPFAARTQGTTTMTPGGAPQATTPRSPFAPPVVQQPMQLPQQPVRGATGYVRPANPFGPQPGGTVSRPFSTPVQPYNNRVLRQSNARDY
jgi:hypothetical protein